GGRRGRRRCLALLVSQNGVVHQLCCPRALARVRGRVTENRIVGKGALLRTLLRRASLIAQRLNRIEACCPPGRIERGQQRQCECHHDYRCRLATIDIGGQLRKKVQFGREQLRV